MTGVAACVVLAGPVAVAHANDNRIIHTLNVYGPKIVKDESAIKSGINGYAKGRVKPLIRALNREVGTLHTLNFKLRHERASSRKGRKAKRDLISGFRLIANAYVKLRNAVLAAHGGRVSPTAVNAAIHARKKGHAKVVAGLKLLGG